MRGVLIFSLSIIVALIFVLSQRSSAQAEKVLGTVRLENGFYTYAPVEPIRTISDDYFTYWLGMSDGKYYLFDPYKKIWYPSPVQYLRTKLLFRGAEVEGFIRVWGRNQVFIDGNYFFGSDGVVYENVKKYKRIGPRGKRHRRLRESYYVNTLTGERSDLPPRTPEEEKAYQELLKSAFIGLKQGDAFPLWSGREFMPEQPGTTPNVSEEARESEEVSPEVKVLEEPKSDAEGEGSGS